MSRASLATTATVSTTREIKLNARLEKQLRQRLKSFLAIKTEFDALKAALKDETEEIGKLREKTGEKTIQFEGFTITNVTGDTSKLDTKKLIELGCAAAWIEEATTTKPKKAYTLVTAPGSRKRGGDDDDE